MFTKKQVLDKITELTNYCKEHGEPTGDYEGYINLLIPPITNYFDKPPATLSENVTDLIPKLYNDLILRDTTYEHPIGKPPSTNYPEGYNDISSIFDGDGVFSEIMDMDAESFLQGFPVEESTDPTTGETSVAVQQNMCVTVWTIALVGAMSEDMAKMDAITKFCEQCAFGQELITIFEDRGKSTRTKDGQSLAREIYIEKGIKDVIETFGLDVHIPTYL